MGTNKLEFFDTQKILLSVWVLGIVLMHFVITYVGGFALTLAALVYPIVVLLLVPYIRIKPHEHMIAYGLVAYVLFMGMFALSPLEYTKSALQFLAALLAVVVVKGVLLPKTKNIALSLKLFYVLAVVVAVYVLIQFIAMNYFWSFSFNNPFGSFSKLGPGGEIYLPHPLAPIKRPNSLFSEPSVAGWFLAFALAVSLTFPLFGVRGVLLQALFSISAILTWSLSGFINVVLVVVMYLYCTRMQLRQVVVVALIIFALAVFVGVAFYDVLVARSATIFEEGTSAYYRLVAPSLLIWDSLQLFPLGHPLGQVDFIQTRDYMINWSDGSNTNIDNSFFMIVYYFGLIGLFGVMMLTIGFIRLLKSKRPVAVVVGALLLALSQTGAFWAQGTVLLICYVILLARFDESDINRVMNT